MNARGCLTYLVDDLIECVARTGEPDAARVPDWAIRN